MTATTESPTKVRFARRSTQGIILGPGVGRALAEWVDSGAPTVDASDLDVRRFSPAQAGRSAALHGQRSQASARLR